MGRVMAFLAADPPARPVWQRVLVPAGGLVLIAAGLVLLVLPGPGLPLLLAGAPCVAAVHPRAEAACRRTLHGAALAVQQRTWRPAGARRRWRWRPCGGGDEGARAAAGGDEGASSEVTAVVLAEPLTGPAAAGVQQGVGGMV